MADITLGSSASAVSARPELSIHNGIVITLSTDLARHFGKRHDDVLRTIRNLLPQLSAEHLRNFAEASVEVESGNGAKASYPAYRLTRDGFTLLAMGFTGKKALAFKLAYIDAFNRMEAELQKPAYDPDRITLAHRAALVATAEVYQSVFDAVTQGQDWQLNRYMLRFDATAEDGAVARVKPVDRNAYVMPIERFHSAIDDSMCVDAQTLTQLASTCTTRLGRMAARNAVAGTQGSLQLR
nr:Rha family transcriptional regulator [uncultured Comamonas sp.]